jgi:hypothetical protein
MRRRNMRLLLPSLVLALLSSCSGESGRGSAPAAPSGSTVNIVEIVPSASETLAVGQKVNLKVKAAYTLAAESATLGLVVQDAGTVGLAQTVAVVSRGSGNEELSVEFTVPDTKAVQVFVPLTVQGQSSTATVSSRVYKVASQ